MNVLASKQSKKSETEVKCLYDDVVTLKMAIEEAIIKGQKSLVVLSDVPEFGPVSDEDLAFTCAGAGAGVIGWVDDF